jgi:hypothetical protein
VFVSISFHLVVAESWGSELACFGLKARLRWREVLARADAGFDANVVIWIEHMSFLKFLCPP